MKLGFRYLELGNGTRHSERSATKRIVRGCFCSMRSGVTFVSFVIAFSSLVFFCGCTDYVAQIDDRIESIQHEKNSSSEKISASSSWKWNVYTMTDSRDGQIYEFVKIGEQFWMSENLNYKTAKSYCYGDKESNCSKYGRLYTWAAAVGKSEKECANECSLPSGNVQGVCPDGWHLPSKAEWNALLITVGSVPAVRLKDTSGWANDGNGLNIYGFSVKPAGSKSNGEYSNEGDDAYFWSATMVNDTGKAFALNINYDQGDVSSGSFDRSTAFSVRCVMGAGTTVESSSSKKISSSSAKSSSSKANPYHGGKGFLTDVRDSQTYDIVAIGSQTWMAENLNFETEDSYCYNDSAEYCEKYGRLYEWASAMEACPSGWHLPNKDEWLALFAFVGDSSSANLGLKSTNGWIDNLNGSDAYGFSMLPGGFRDVGGVYINEKRVAFFWSSADKDDTFAYYMSFVSTSSKQADPSMKLDYKNEALSVRCVRD